MFTYVEILCPHHSTRTRTIYDSKNAVMYVWKNIGTKNAKNRENMHRPIFQRVKGTESLPPLTPLTSARNGRLYKGISHKCPLFSTQSFSGLTASFRRRYFSKKKRKELLPMGFRGRPESEFAAANSVLVIPWTPSFRINVFRKKNICSIRDTLYHTNRCLSMPFYVF